MTQAQIDECTFIKEFVRSILFREYQRKTAFHSIQKRTVNTNPCYVVIFNCVKYLCSSSWTIFIEVEKREAYLTASKLCKHLAFNEKLCKY
jgi:hypothetical protein